MIINSLKSVFTYTNSETFDLINNTNNSIDYNNFINSISVIYGNQRADGSIPVFWTKVIDNDSLERKADPESTLKKLDPNQSYYIELLDISKLPVKIPDVLNSNNFLSVSIDEEKIDNHQKTLDNIYITSSDHRNICLTSSNYSDLHIQLSGLQLDKKYTYIIDPIFSNWPHTVSPRSGELIRNQPIDNNGFTNSSIDTKIKYLIEDDLTEYNKALPFNLINISNSFFSPANNDYTKNIFSLYNLKIIDEHERLLINDTISVRCSGCLPSQHVLLKSLQDTVRQCPVITLNESNIFASESTAIVSGSILNLNPSVSYNYGFTPNIANWSMTISPVVSNIPIQSTYIENAVVYGSGDLIATIEFNDDLEQDSYNVPFTLPDYRREDFFNSNLYANLNVTVFGSDGCGNTTNTINVICPGCIKIVDKAKCVRSLYVNIQNTTIDYPDPILGNRPGAEITVNDNCCDNVNGVFATITGLCPDYSYLYEWSSIPNIGVSPSSGILNANNGDTQLAAIYNLQNNKMSNIKLKIFDASKTLFAEDNILIRCSGSSCVESPPSPPSPSPGVSNNSANYGSRVSTSTRVGSNGRPSAYGTYDQNGNVWEWLTESTFAPFSLSTANANLRGGSYLSAITALRSTYSQNQISRAIATNSSTNIDSGFRVMSFTNPHGFSNFVNIGNAGNSPDSFLKGAVSYAYKISRYPVTVCEYVEFLNSVAAFNDPNGLYNNSIMGSFITRISNTDGISSFSCASTISRRAMTGVPWTSAVRYCNWLHNNKPSGGQTFGTTESGAYYINNQNIFTYLNSTDIIRWQNIFKVDQSSDNLTDYLSQALYRLPTDDEWYKAAYYSGNGLVSPYWAFATQSNADPTSINGVATAIDYSGKIGTALANISTYECPS